MQEIWDKIKANPVAWAGLGLVATLLFVLFLTPKARADGPTKSVSILPDIPGVTTAKGSWTGFHVDGSVGYGWNRSEFTEQKWWTTREASFDSRNVLLTAGIGWDAQIGNMVLGIMADVTASDLNDTEWQWFAGVRGGVLVAPKTLIYGLVGYTETIDGQLAFKAIEATKFKDIAGLTYGGGIEHIFAQGWSLKAEYRYVQFEDETAPDGVKDGLKDGTDVESGAHQVRFGVSRRF